MRGGKRKRSNRGSWFRTPEHVRSTIIATAPWPGLSVSLSEGHSDVALAPCQAISRNQSSFATHALASEKNTVKVPDDVPLELLGPLGCGIQTGAGAVMGTPMVVVPLTALPAVSGYDGRTIAALEDLCSAPLMALPIGDTVGPHALFTEAGHPVNAIDRDALAAAVVNEAVGCVGEDVAGGGSLAEDVRDVNVVAGAGMAGTVEGRAVKVGTAAFCGVTTETWAPKHPGATLVWVAIDNIPSLCLAVVDPLRAETPRALQTMFGMGLRVAVLTGATPAVIFFFSRRRTRV